MQKRVNNEILQGREILQEAAWCSRHIELNFPPLDLTISAVEFSPFGRGSGTETSCLLPAAFSSEWQSFFKPEISLLHQQPLV